MTRLITALVLLVLVLTPIAASAQSLADVARAEAARRKSVAAAGKVYTNDSLTPDPFTPPPVTPASPDATDATETPATPDTAETPATGEAARDEAYWSARIGAVRAQLQRSRMFAEALQSRLNGLNADFVARDDPSQRAVIADERDKALAELERVNAEIQEHNDAIAEIQEEARRAGVPPGWLRDRS